METMLTDEQIQFAQMLDRFAEQEFADRSGAHSFDHGRWKRIAELGCLSLAIPEDLGGFGGGVERMLVMQHLASALPREPILVSGIQAASLLAAALPNPSAAELLPGVADGGVIVTVAHQEEGSRYGLGQVSTRACVSGEGWVLNGTKRLVEFATEADVFIISVRNAEDGVLSLFRVDAGARGLHVTPQSSVDGLPRADLVLEDCRAALIADTGVDAMIATATDQAEAAQVAEMVGLMDALIRETIGYLQVRRQFGTEIGRFQALQHRIADMWMYCEETRSLALAAALSCDAPAEERARTVSRAKMFACDAARIVANEAVQMHGGIGVTDELIVGHWFKRLLALRSSLGDRRFHLARLIEQDRTAA